VTVVKLQLGRVSRMCRIASREAMRLERFGAGLAVTVIARAADVGPDFISAAAF